MRTMRLLLTVLATVAFTAQAADERQVDERRPLRADGEVRVSNIAGEINVVGWDRNEVRVSGRLGRDVERLEFTGGEASVEVRVIIPRRCHNCRADADLTIHVPVRARMEVEAVSADVNAKGVDGTLRLKSVSGDVAVESRSTDLSLKSVSGDVVTTGSGEKARIEAKTVSGSVRVSGATGEVRAGSVSGDVEVRGGRVARLEVESTSGNAEYDGPLAAGGSYEFESVSGGVELRISGSRDATYDISTFSGDIDNDFGPKPRRTSEYGPGRELRFTEGKGAARVRMNTLSGSIVLR